MNDLYFGATIYNTVVGWFGILWPINSCELFNAKF